MKRFQTIVVSVAALSLAIACSKKESSEGEAPTAAAKTAEPAPVAPFTGELNKDIINASAGLVQPFDNWEAGFAKLKGTMGEPTLVDENNYYWGLMAGEECTSTYVSKENEAEYHKDKADPQDMVGAVSKPQTVTKDHPSWDSCIKAAGIKAEDLEDPEAPVPAADGVASIEDFRAGMKGAKSKWIDKEITIQGVLRSVSRSSVAGSDQKTTTISIGAAATGGDTVSCTLSDGSQAEGLVQGASLSVKGAAKDYFGGALEDCAIQAE